MTCVNDMCQWPRTTLKTRPKIKHYDVWKICTHEDSRRTTSTFTVEASTELGFDSWGNWQTVSMIVGQDEGTNDNRDNSCLRIHISKSINNGKRSIDYALHPTRGPPYTRANSYEDWTWAHKITCAPSTKVCLETWSELWVGGKNQTETTKRESNNAVSCDAELLLSVISSWLKSVICDR